jgi:hypothetical protein
MNLQRCCKYGPESPVWVDAVEKWPSVIGFPIGNCFGVKVILVLMGVTAWPANASGIVYAGGIHLNLESFSVFEPLGAV